MTGHKFRAEQVKSTTQNISHKLPIRQYFQVEILLGNKPLGHLSLNQINRFFPLKPTKEEWAFILSIVQINIYLVRGNCAFDISIVNRHKTSMCYLRRNNQMVIVILTIYVTQGDIHSLYEEITHKKHNSAHSQRKQNGM